MSRPVASSTTKSGDLTRGNVVAEKQKIRTRFVGRSSNPVNRSNLPVPESKVIGYYSVDGDRNFLPNASKLRYYNPPAEMKVYADLSRGVHMDLDEGIDMAVRRDISFLDEGVSMLLEWIKRNKTRIKAPPDTGRWIQPKFACMRGTVEQLLRSAPNPRNTWIMYAARWKGTIYLITDKNSKKAEYSDTNHSRFGSWGHKFEQCVLSKSPDELPDTTKLVNEAEEFRCVYQRNIGGHSVIFCSIMKGLLSNKPLKEPLWLDQLKFIEVRTNRIIEFAHQETNFNKFKILQWWAQCYLTNTKHVLCGFRDDTGIVHKLTIYDLQKIIELGKPYWQPGRCVNFCKSILTKIQETVVRDCNENIYKIERRPGGQIDIRELPASSEHAFLPSSFLEASG